MPGAVPSPRPRRADSQRPGLKALQNYLISLISANFGFFIYSAFLVKTKISYLIYSRINLSGVFYLYPFRLRV